LKLLERTKKILRSDKSASTRFDPIVEKAHQLFQDAILQDPSNILNLYDYAKFLLTECHQPQEALEYLLAVLKVREIEKKIVTDVVVV
jgi:hypothetical protein